MAVELKVPQAGESITEVQIGHWHKGVGDYVELDEPIVEIETDKVTMDLLAPAAGVITKLIKETGESATIDEVVGMLDETASPDKAASEKPSQESASKTPAEAEAPVKPAQKTAAQGHVMPAAERVLAEKGINADQVKGTGPGGRILKEDAERAAATPTSSASPSQQGSRQEEVVRMSPLRRQIAKRLVEAQQTMAMLTTFNEADMSAVMELRKQYKDAFLKRYEIKLGFMSFFVKAAVDALKQFPAVNAEIRDDTIVYKNYFDIGVAIGGGRGLVVPVIRNAENLSFSEVEQSIADFAAKAKNNRLTIEEMQGGTFTITNGGVYGSLLSTPIVNPPQSGILGMHGIFERPIAVNGEVVIRPMMNLALSYDHRIIDGREAVSFLKRIKEAIEAPERMLIEI